jgi:hypothetical protein
VRVLSACAGTCCLCGYVLLVRVLAAYSGTCYLCGYLLFVPVLGACAGTCCLCVYLLLVRVLAAYAVSPVWDYGPRDQLFERVSSIVYFSSDRQIRGLCHKLGCDRSVGLSFLYSYIVLRIKSSILSC